LAYQAIAQLQRLSELFARRRVRLAAATGLTEQQWRLLEEISTEHFMPSLFARGRETSLPAVSKIIRQLLDKKLITVSVSDSDGRQRRYVLSPEGKANLDTLRALRELAIDAIWMELGRESLEAFSQSSALIIDRIERYEESERQTPKSGKAGAPAKQ